MRPFLLRTASPLAAAGITFATLGTAPTLAASPRIVHTPKSPQPHQLTTNIASNHVTRSSLPGKMVAVSFEHARTVWPAGQVMRRRGHVRIPNLARRSQPVDAAARLFRTQAAASEPPLTVTAGVGSGGATIVGPDGALWSTSGVGIIRTTVSGQITTYTDGDMGVLGITAGPDGAVWFTGESASSSFIGRITTSGALTEFQLPANAGVPVGIVTGPDGAIWFTTASGLVGRLTTRGGLTSFAAPAPYLDASGNSLIVGPDGALWFYSPDSVFRMTLDGRFSVYLVCPAAALQNCPPVTGIAVGPDGDIWFTEEATGPVGDGIPGFPGGVFRMTLGGTITGSYGGVNLS
jgi:hypothetical protein